MNFIKPLNIPYQPTMSLAGIPIKREPMSPRHVAIWVKPPKVPRTAGGETYKCKWSFQVLTEKTGI